VYRNGELVANIPVTQSGMTIGSHCQMPFLAKIELSNFAAKTGQKTSYEEWRWEWKK
jgi:hypothetical protein